MPVPVFLVLLALSILFACGGEEAPRLGSLPDRVELVGGTSVHVVRRGAGGRVPVLLLHGARFHSGTWERLGTIDRLVEAGHPVAAVDLPGFGESAPSSIAPEALIGELLDALGLERCAVLAASMSGRFALPFVADSPERCAGLIAVAPVGIESVAPRIRDGSVPALLVWGSEDTIVPPELAELLAGRFDEARIEVLPGAGHPCYLDRPERFHEILIEFLRELD